MSNAEQCDDQQLQWMTRELSTFLVTHSAGRLAEVPAGAQCLLSHPAVVLAAMGQQPVKNPIH